MILQKSFLYTDLLLKKHYLLLVLKTIVLIIYLFISLLSFEDFCQF